MRRFGLFTIAALVLVAPAAYADSYTVTDTITAGPLEDNSAPLPAFDASLGALTDVQYSLAAVFHLDLAANPGPGVVLPASVDIEYGAVFRVSDLVDSDTVGLAGAPLQFDAKGNAYYAATGPYSGLSGNLSGPDVGFFTPSFSVSGVSADVCNDYFEAYCLETIGFSNQASSVTVTGTATYTYTPNPAPEPVSAAVLGVGLLGLAAVRRLT